jgi:hypothetical protein
MSDQHAAVITVRDPEANPPDLATLAMYGGLNHPSREFNDGVVL